MKPGHRRWAVGSIRCQLLVVFAFLLELDNKQSLRAIPRDPHQLDVLRANEGKRGFDVFFCTDRRTGERQQDVAGVDASHGCCATLFHVYDE